MKRINFFATKGGIGVTTVAVSYALAHQQPGQTVAVVVNDTEWCAHLGLATVDDEMMPYEFTEGVWAVRQHMLDDHNFDLVVGDLGVAVPPAGQFNLFVTKSCYLSLSKFVRANLTASGIVLMQEVGRALTAKDIERACGAPVLKTVDINPVVSRLVDAGLLVSRIPADLRDWTQIDETCVAV